MRLTQGYFSKFEFNVHCGYESIAILECDLISRILSYQECGNTGVVILDSTRYLDDEQFDELLTYIKIADFEKCLLHEPNTFNSNLVAYKRSISITFTGFDYAGKPIIMYEMDTIYKAWQNWPTDKLYDYLSNKFFSKERYRRFFIYAGLITCVREAN